MRTTRPGPETAAATGLPWWRDSTWRVVALLGACGALVYGNTLGNPFVFDDGFAITGNPNIRHLWPLGQALGAPAGSGASGRPVVALSLALNYAAGGLHVLGYHLFNIAAHVGVAIVLFGLARRTFASPRLVARFGGRRTPLAVAIALLWLLHPLQTAALDHVSYRNEILMGLFYLLTLYGVARVAGGTAIAARRWSLLTVGACLLGMGSKEAMVTAPCIAALYDRVFWSASWAAVFRARRGLYAGLAATWIVLALCIGAGSRGDSVTVHSTFCTPADYARTQFGVVLHYLQLAVWPRSLAIDVEWPVAKSWGAVWPAAGCIVALWIATVWALWRRPVWGFLGAWFFVVLAPTSSIVPLTGAIVGAHRMYVPLVALVAAVVAAGSLLLDRWVPARGSLARVAGTAGVALLAVGLGTCTFERNRVFQSDITLWTDAVTKSPGNARAHNNLGSALLRQGQLEAAQGHFATALRLDPNSAEALGNRASALIRQGNLDAAAVDLRRALQLAPRNAPAHYNMGLIALRRGDPNTAATAFRAALAADPGMAEAHYNLGLACLQSRDESAATQEFRAAIELNADHAGALNNLAWVLATSANPRRRDGAAAVRYAERAVRLGRDTDPDWLDTLAASYAEAGRFDAAVATVERALQQAAASGRQQLAPKLTARLALYKAHEPYRMP